MEQVLGYFKEADKLLQANEFDSQEDFDTFLQNVFAEVDGLEKRMSCHHDGSQILERILGYASDFQVRVFFDRISGEMAKLATHRCASHVMESLLKRSETLLQAKSSEEHEGLASLSEMMVRFSNEIGEAFESVLCNSWGSHVYRRMIVLLSTAGITEFQKELRTILENISLSDTKFLRDLAFDQYASPALQAIISASAGQPDKDLTKHILDKIFGDFDSQDGKTFLLRAASNEYASHLVEICLKAFDSPSFLQFYTKAVHPNFQTLLQGTPSNFLLQHIITACHNEAQLKIVLADLEPFLEGLIEMKRAGLLVRLLQWTVDHKGIAEDVVAQAFFISFHAKTTTEKKQIFSRVIRLQPIEYNEGASVVPLGCQILSAAAGLKPETIKPFVDNILDLTSDELVALSKHHTASRTLEAFISRGAFSDKALGRFVRKLQGSFGSLAADKSASHVVERLWGASKTDLKSLIMSELAAAKKRLEDTAHGRLVLRNCRVHEFERKQDDWVQEEAAVERKRAYFADLIDIEGTKPKKSSKKKKKTTEESLLLTEDL